MNCRKRGSDMSCDWSSAARMSSSVMARRSRRCPGCRSSPCAARCAARPPAPRCAGSRAGGRPDRRGSSSRHRRASAVVIGPYSRTSGRPLACRSASSSCSSHPVRQRTRVAMRSMPARSRWRSPMATAGIDRKFSVPSSKPASPGESRCGARLHGGEVDRAAGKPRPHQAGERVAPGQQAAHAGGVAEHLVEGDRRRSRPAPPRGRAGWPARTRPRRAARPSRAPGPRPRDPADA